MTNCGTRSDRGTRHWWQRTRPCGTLPPPSVSHAAPGTVVSSASAFHRAAACAMPGHALANGGGRLAVRIASRLARRRHAASSDDGAHKCSHPEATLVPPPFLGTHHQQKVLRLDPRHLPGHERGGGGAVTVDHA